MLGAQLAIVQPDLQQRNLRSIKDTLNTVANLWQIRDPEFDTGFPVLDRHLLRRSLQLLFKDQHGRHPKRARSKYRTQVQQMLEALNPTGLSPGQWVSFLNYKMDEQTHPQLLDADGTKPEFDPEHSKQLSARETLLLRLATGCAATLVEAVGQNVRDSLKFWWSEPSVKRHPRRTGKRYKRFCMGALHYSHDSSPDKPTRQLGITYLPNP